MGTALTLGYIVVASLSFAALSVSPLEPFSFPTVVTLWTAYVWMFTARSIQSFSTKPRRPSRVAMIIVACALVALVALAISIVIGLMMIAPR